MLPIGWMYYFSTDLEERFSVPDFWPAPEMTHRIPFEREELDQVAAQLKAEWLEQRRRELKHIKVKMQEDAADGIWQTGQIEGMEQARQVTAPNGTLR